MGRVFILLLHIKMQAIQGAELDAVPVRWENGPSGYQEATVVYLRTPNTRWQPWVVVAESAVLNSLGFKGQGLYAAKPFKKDDVIGRYEGQVVGVFENREEALQSDVTKRLVRMQRDKLITRNRKGGGVELVDGHTQGPPYLAKVNDPRGTNMRPNVVISPFGYMRVLQARIPAFNFDLGLEANRASELRFAYGDEYWQTMARLGKSDDFSILVE